MNHQINFENVLKKSITHQFSKIAKFCKAIYLRIRCRFFAKITLFSKISISKLWNSRFSKFWKKRLFIIFLSINISKSYKVINFFENVLIQNRFFFSRRVLLTCCKCNAFSAQDLHKENINMLSLFVHNFFNILYISSTLHFVSKHKNTDLFIRTPIFSNSADIFRRRLLLITSYATSISIAFAYHFGL